MATRFYAYNPGMKNVLTCRRAVVVVLLALSLTAASLPGGKPEDVGMSADRLGPPHRERWGGKEA